MKKKLKRHGNKQVQNQPPQKTPPKTSQPVQSAIENEPKAVNIQPEQTVRNVAPAPKPAPASVHQPPPVQPSSNAPIYFGFIVVIAAVAGLALYLNIQIETLETSIADQSKTITSSLQESKSGTDQTLIANVSGETQKIIDAVQQTKSFADDALAKFSAEWDAKWNTKIDQSTEQLTRKVDEIVAAGQQIGEKIDNIQTTPITDNLASLSAKLEQNSEKILSTIIGVEETLQTVPNRVSSEIQTTESEILQVLYQLRENSDSQRDQLQQLLVDYQTLKKSVDGQMVAIQNELKKMNNKPAPEPAEEPTPTQ
jgi:predicted RND superfamily exporter protein